MEHYMQISGMPVPLFDMKYYIVTFVLWVVLKTVTFRDNRGTLDQTEWRIRR